MLTIKEIDKTPNYILVRMTSPYNLKLLFEADAWCVQHKVGKRVNRHSFAFKTEAELTMFALRWIK